MQQRGPEAPTAADQGVTSYPEAQRAGGEASSPRGARRSTASHDQTVLCSSRN